MGWRTFYWRWLRTAFGGAFDRTALVAFGLFAAAEVARRFFAATVPVVSDWYWSIPFWALVIVIAWRLIRAPFVIWREDHTELVAVRGAKQRQAERALHAQKLAELYSEGHALFAGVIADEADFEKWKGEIQAWRERLFEAVTAAVGAATAQTLDTVTSVSAGHYVGSYSSEHSNRKLYLSERLDRVRALSQRLEGDPAS